MGAPITLAQMQAIPDILDQTKFVLNLGQLPGSGDSQALSVKCFNAVVPGTSHERYETNMGGFKRSFRGRRLFTNIMQVSFYEDADGDTYNKLLNWLEFIAGTDSNSSGDYIDGYAVPAILEQYDTMNALTHSFEIHRTAIFDIADSSLTTESSTAVQVQAQLSYDWYYKNGIAYR